jgi:signal peptidase I
MIAEEDDGVAEERTKETTVEFLSSLAAVLVTGLFIITFVMQAFEIPSSSMAITYS